MVYVEALIWASQLLWLNHCWLFSQQSGNVIFTVKRYFDFAYYVDGEAVWLVLCDRTTVLISSHGSCLPPQRNVTQTCDWQPVLNLRSLDFSLDIWPKLCNCLLYVLLEVSRDEVNKANSFSLHWDEASFLWSAFTLKPFYMSNVEAFKSCGLVFCSVLLLHSIVGSSCTWDLSHRLRIISLRILLIHLW